MFSNKNHIIITCENILAAIDYTENPNVSLKQMPFYKLTTFWVGNMVRS